jgi:TRAP-type mannitol/chloroaromatic compound transport system permease small subunit
MVTTKTIIFWIFQLKLSERQLNFFGIVATTAKAFTVTTFEAFGLDIFWTKISERLQIWDCNASP